MSESQCPVHETLLELKAISSTRRVVHPRSRRLAEEIATLIEDIVTSRAGNEHLPSIDARIAELLIPREQVTVTARKAAKDTYDDGPDLP